MDSVAPIQESGRAARPSMRIAIRLGLMLAFGIVASLIVALACSLMQNGMMSWTWDASGKPVSKPWLWSPPAGWPRAPDSHMWDRSLGYDIEEVSWNGGQQGQSMSAPLMACVQTRFGAGFPLAALEARHEGRTGAVAKAEYGRFAFYSWDRGGTYQPTPSSPLVIVPMLPNWPGLFIDAALYGTVGGLLVLWVGGRRRRRRVRRQECANCGYALEGLATCPECGAAASAPAPSPRP